MDAVASSQESARFHKAEPVLITEAQPSLIEQHAARKRRYVLTMAVRALSLVMAAVVYSATHILWLVLVLAALGTVLPWVAVVMANDGPPKSKQHVPRYRPERTLEGPPARAIESSRIIDG
jgi:Flp pilus assembly protein TadB